MVDDGLGEPDQGALPRGERLRALLGKVRDAQFFEHRACRGPRILHAVEGGEQHEGLEHGHSIRQRDVARGESHLCHRSGASRGQPVTHELDRSSIGFDGTEQHQQGRGLAGTVRPDDPDPLAAADLEVQSVDRNGAVEALRQPVRAQDDVRSRSFVHRVILTDRRCQVT